MSNGNAGDRQRTWQRATRIELPRRFYQEVSVAERDAGLAVLLDGKPVLTPGRAALLLETRALAEAAAGEWQAQGEHIDPATMPLTRLINSALDGVRGREDEVVGDIVSYASSDLLCYRATHPAELARRQAEKWDPVLGSLADHLGATFTVVAGIAFQQQPEVSLSKVRQRVARERVLRLAAVHTMTTLTGSALLALAHADGKLDLSGAWAAAHIDEDWQIEQWGADAEARQRRAARFAEFEVAGLVLALTDPAG